jgi:hypothetical protein
LLTCAFDHSLDVLRHGDVGYERGRLPALFGDESDRFGRGSPIAIDRDNGCALASRQHSDGSTVADRLVVQVVVGLARSDHDDPTSGQPAAARRFTSRLAGKIDHRGQPRIP